MAARDQAASSATPADNAADALRAELERLRLEVVAMRSAHEID